MTGAILCLTAACSPQDSGSSYGYGLMGMAYGGAGHPGAIGTCAALDYINPEHGLRLFIASNKASSQSYRLSPVGAVKELY